MDDVTGLDELVAQRKSRPLVTRMISWEIDNSENTSERRRREISTASKDGSSSEDEEGGDNSEDSDDCEYYAAGEEVTSVSDDSCDSQSNYTSADQQSERTEKNCTSFTTDEIDSVFDSLGSSSLSDKKRSLSKKKKKRRRDKLRDMMVTAYADYDVPFRNVEDLDIEVSDLVGYSDEIFRRCTRNVPTLFELCVSVISVKRQNKPRQSTSELPQVMKNVLADKRRNISFASVQLSWLYRLMGHAEENLYSRFLFQKELNSCYKLKLDSRNIWSSCYLDNQDSSLVYIGSPLSSILRYSYLFYEYLLSISVYWRFPFGLLTVVASVVDLMLPQQLSTGRLRHASQDCSTEFEVIHKSTDAIVYSVKQILKKRYPGVVKFFFDEAVPYVFWARGNLKFAAESFVTLAKTKEGAERAMLLSEAARLYAQNEESDKARRLYMEASGAVITKATNLKQDHDVTLQQFMLMASVYDQGVMTPDKSQVAGDAWKAAMKYFDLKCPWSSATRAVESFLCFHGGSSNGNPKERLERAVTLIENLCKNCDMLFLYLSLVRALLGDARPCYHAYRAFVTSSTAEFHELLEMPSGGNSPSLTPWQPLIDHFQNHGVPQLLKVVWRTQLGHLRIVNDVQLFEADIVAKADLNLRLTETGYLTADIQMMLPPIRALNLDPYTGLHVHTSGQTQEWHSLSNICICHAINMSGFFLVPTLAELYKDEYGNRIQILSPDDSVLTNNESMSRQLTLFWLEADGQRAKLNLIPYLQEVVKQYTLDLINMEMKNNQAPTKNKRGSPSWVEDMRLATDYCHKNGYAMGITKSEKVRASRIWQVIQKRNNLPSDKSKKVKMTKKEWRQRKKEEKKMKKEEKKKMKEITSVDIPAFAAQLEEYYQYKDTLYLAFDPSEDGHKRIHVFIGCRSREDFLEPVVTMENTHAYYMDDDLVVSSMHTTKCPPILEDEIMWRTGYDGEPHYLSKPLYKVYGRKGEVLRTTKPDGKGMELPHVLGRKLYGFSQDRLRVSCDNLTDGVVSSEELPRIHSLLFGGGKVIAVTEGGIFFLNPDTLSVLSVKQQPASTYTELSENGSCIKYLDRSKVKVFEQKIVNYGDEEKFRVAMGIGSTLVFVDVNDGDVEIVLDVKLPGLPKEVCTVSAQVGFLVTATIHADNTEEPEEAEEPNFYRENLFYYRFDGKLNGVLPFLGPGPRCFCVEYLRGSGEVSESGIGESGWYVFMRDGHDGIIGVRLP